MTDEEIRKIGDEVVRVLEPVYEQLERIEQKQDRMDKKQDRMDKKQDRMEQKQDAQTSDIMILQKKADITNDRFVKLEEKIDTNLKENRDELNRLKKHVKLPSAAFD